VPGGHLDRGRRGATEIDLWQQERYRTEGSFLHPEMIPGEAHRFPGPERPDDLQEFVGAGVALVLAVEIAEGALFLAFSADHHIQ
jgi:hypothetical protein